LRWGLMNFLPGLAFNHDPPFQSQPPSASQVARIIGVSHQRQYGGWT
jgi:hypothetical protein